MPKTKAGLVHQSNIKVRHNVLNTPFTGETKIVKIRSKKSTKHMLKLDAENCDISQKNIKEKLNRTMHVLMNRKI